MLGHKSSLQVLQRKPSLICVWIMCVGLVGCSLSSERPTNQYREAQEERPLVSPEYRLSADRSALDQIREQVPGDVKLANDELALIMGMMVEVRRTPSEIRERFNQLVRKNRQSFDKGLKAERETFTKSERKKRDEFLKEANQTRGDYFKTKPSKEDRAEFVRDQEQKRADFFATEKEKRSDFESDVRERRRSFEDYIRQKTNEFNQELRNYTKKFDDEKKAKNQRSKNKAEEGDLSETKSELESLEKELMMFQNKPGTILRSGQ
jgi:hypothetical protein